MTSLTIELPDELAERVERTGIKSLLTERIAQSQRGELVYDSISELGVILFFGA